MQLEEFLENSASRSPDKIAVVAGDQRWTYGETEALCNRFAATLTGLNVQRWDRVVICLWTTRWK
jgi:non-ribosomal peptide synthetase component E (peptide arylation enzyme)